MRHQALTLSLALAGALATPSAAFADTQPAAKAKVPEKTVTIMVDNQNFADMDLYAVGDGIWYRIGMVTGESEATFTLRHPLFGDNTVQIVARPIGGWGYASTGLLNVKAGDTVEFTVSPLLSASGVFVW